MRTIWKFPLQIRDVQDIEVPCFSKPLHVAMQDGKLCLWILTTLNEYPNASLQVRLFGTGQPIPKHIIDALSYIGTVQDGSFIWHIFYFQGANIK